MGLAPQLHESVASLSLTLPPLLSHRGDSTGSPRGLKMQPGLKWEPPPRAGPVCSGVTSMVLLN